MAYRKVKFSLSIKELSIQFEGDRRTGQDFQAGVQRALGGLLESQGRALGVEEEPNVIDVTPTPAVTPVRRRRRKTKSVQVDGASTPRPPTSRAGSVGTQLGVLLEDGLFRQGQKLGDVRKAFTNRGHNFSRQSVASALQRFTQEGKLSREKDEKGEFVYTTK